MRLSDEKIADIKEYLNRSIKVTASSLIPQLSKYGIDLIDTIEALQQENEQLQAHVARMREALTIANNYMPDIGHFCTCGKCKRCGADINYAGYKYCLKCARVIIDEALSDTPADYHNPADVAEIEKLRNVIEEIKDNLHAINCVREMPDKVEMYANEAISIIDEMGGKNDV